MASEQQGHHLTGSPVTVRPMTRRWISDVPSKIVKIFGRAGTALLSRIYAGKAAYSPAGLGLERPRTAPNDASVIPSVLPAGAAQFPVQVLAGRACCICRKPWPQVVYDVMADGTPLLMCDDHELPVGAL